ncbi:MAG: hypothetical protein IKG08_10970 [Eubacterium sp.]|nr:hypothetical protein [Eubacterium sp.]
MLTGFIIWTAVSALMAVIGVITWRSEKSAGFYAGVEGPQVKNVKKYNHAVAKLWFAYAAVLELLGLPLLSGRQNSPVFIITVLGTVAASVGLAAGYHFILAKHQEKK